jgi:hypothetical protein
MTVRIIPDAFQRHRNSRRSGFSYALTVMADRFSILCKLLVTDQMTFCSQLIHSLSKIFAIRLLVPFFPRVSCCHISVTKSIDFISIRPFLLAYKCRTRCLYLSYALKIPSVFMKRMKVFENLLFLLFNYKFSHL